MKTQFTFLDRRTTAAALLASLVMTFTLLGAVNAGFGTVPVANQNTAQIEEVVVEG